EWLPYAGRVRDAGEIADACFRGLAARVAAAQGARVSEELLVALWRGPVEAAGYWTRVLESAAVAGELVRAAHGGRWVEGPVDGRAVVPFVFETRGGGRADVVGRARAEMLRAEEVE